MPCPMEFEDNDRPLQDYEYPDESDLSDDDANVDSTAPCPHCGAEIYDDSIRCPICGEYIESFNSNSDRFSKHPVWIVLAVLTCLGFVLFLFAQ